MKLELRVERKVINSRHLSRSRISLLNYNEVVVVGFLPINATVAPFAAVTNNSQLNKIF